MSCATVARSMGMPLVALRAVPDPLPQLRARDLGRGRVFHEVVDRRRAGAGEPRLEVAQADVDVEPHARLGDRSTR